MQHWLMKTEPTSFSIDDLARAKVTHWDGVRNYQARNLMRAMAVGDRVLVYHSNAEPSGVAGTAIVAKAAYPDHTAWDRDDPHFDPKSNPEAPTWSMVDLRFGSKLPRLVALQELRDDEALTGRLLTSGKASRLSVQPVEPRHFERILAMSRSTPVSGGPTVLAEAGASAKSRRSKPPAKANPSKPRMAR